MDRSLLSASTRLVRNFADDERGGNAIEYALIAAGIAAAVASIVMALGTSVQSLHAQVAAKL